MKNVVARSVDRVFAGRAARIVGCCLLAIGLAAAGQAAQEERAGDAASDVEWRAGADLQKQLRAVVHVEWSEVELRDALDKLSESQRVRIFLDRRVDPDQKVDFTVSGVTLEEFLQRLAVKLKLGVAQVGPVVYLGPPQTAGSLATVAALRRREAAKHQALAKARPKEWSWPELAEPRQLLSDLAGELGLTVANAEQLPHDLWPACQLPPMAPPDRLTLLLAGFSLTYDLPAGAGALRLVPLPAEADYEQTYTPRGDVAKAAADLKQKVPGISVRREGNRLVIRGKFEDHEIITRLLAGESVTTRRVVGTTTYTLRVEKQPAGAVVNTVAQKLGKKLQVAPELQEKLSERVTFSVTDATLDELLTRALGPLGLSYRVTDEAIEVVGKE